MNAFVRTRRTRMTPVLREFVRENRLLPSDMIAPLFVTEGRDVRNPIGSMPGQAQLSIDQLLVEVADLVAAGVPGILQPSHITPGAVVVGGGVRYEGRKLLPDVDEACNEVAGAITPRVGGVGPTTVAMLFKNCVEAAERRLGL